MNQKRASGAPTRICVWENLKKKQAKRRKFRRLRRRIVELLGGQEESGQGFEATEGIYAPYGPIVGRAASCKKGEGATLGLPGRSPIPVLL